VFARPLFNVVTKKNYYQHIELVTR